jgi:hypothetical protein
MTIQQKTRVTGYIVLNHDCTIETFKTLINNNKFLENIIFELKMIENITNKLYKNDRIFFYSKSDIIIDLKNTYNIIKSNINLAFKDDFIKSIVLHKSYDYLMKYESCYICNSKNDVNNCLHVHEDDDQVICSNCLFKCKKCNTRIELYYHDFNYYCSNCLPKKSTSRLLDSFPIIIDSVGKYRTRNNKIVTIDKIKDKYYYNCEGYYKKSKKLYNFNNWHVSGFLLSSKNSGLDIIEKIKDHL